MAGITTNSSNISIHSPRMGRDVKVSDPSTFP